MSYKKVTIYGNSEYIITTSNHFSIKIFFPNHIFLSKNNNKLRLKNIKLHRIYSNQSKGSHPFLSGFVYGNTKSESKKETIRHQNFLNISVMTFHCSL